MRVSMSAMGSVMLIAATLSNLPATLHYVRDFPGECEAPNADAARAKAAHIGARPAAQLASIMLLHAELWWPVGICNHGLLRHSRQSSCVRFTPGVFRSQRALTLL